MTSIGRVSKGAEKRAEKERQRLQKTRPIAPNEPPEIVAQSDSSGTVALDAIQLVRRLGWLRQRMRMHDEVHQRGTAADKRAAMWLALHEVLEFLEDIKATDVPLGPLRDLGMMLYDLEQGVIHDCLKHIPGTRDNSDPTALWVGRAHVALAVEAAKTLTGTYTAAANLVAQQLPDIDRIPERNPSTKLGQARRQVAADKIASRYREGLGSYARSDALHRRLYDQCLALIAEARNDQAKLRQIFDEAIHHARSYLRTVPPKP